MFGLVELDLAYVGLMLGGRKGGGGSCRPIFFFVYQQALVGLGSCDG
jgi:hypothetical protein